MTGLKDISKFSRIGGKTIGTYICTTVVAILIGLAMGLLVQPGKLVNHEQVAHLQEQFIRAMYPVQLFAFTTSSSEGKQLYGVQLFAFTTSSSAATLPVTLKTVEQKLGISEEVSSFVLPVGVTINMDGTSCYQTIAILFIAQVLGIDLSFSQLCIIVAMTVLSSIGTPGIPGGSYVILAMVLTSVGIPVEGLALILGVDRPLDMLRTAVNVTGDAAVCSIIDR